MSTPMNDSDEALIGRQQALAGRIPIAFPNRIYLKYSEFLLTCATLGAASYAYLVGASLASIGNTWVGILGYMLGLVIGTAFVAFAVGLVSYRYGVDPVDASKLALGSRGSVLVLLGVIATCAGWGNVLLAMTARGVLDLIPGTPSAGTPGLEWGVVIPGLLLIALIWSLLRRGAQMMERAAAIGAMIQIGVAILVGVMTIYRFGLQGTLFHNVSADKAYTTDHLLQIAYAVEFGIANGLGLFPFIGGLARLVKRRRHVIGPAVIGYPIAGFDNDLRCGKRRYNFIWYRVGDAAALRDMCVDADGRQHDHSVPPPLIRRDLLDALRREGERELPPAFRDVLRRIERPFFTPIYDFASPQMVFGRIILLGDAAASARPHMGFGVAKAGDDARALADALAGDDDIDRALARYQAVRAPMGERIVRHGRLLGTHLGVDLKTAQDREMWKTLQDYRAMMDWIAVPNFLEK